MSDLNIYQRMNAITSEITAVAKNLNVGYGKSSYKATGEADILAAVKPIESKHGVYSYPVSRKITESGEMVSKKQANGQEYESRQLYMRIETVYRFVNIDNPDDYLEIVSYGDGVDTQDKAPGKAMTYADKYALMKAYKIITGDDPDQNKSEELKGRTTQKVVDEKITAKDVEVLKAMMQRKGVEGEKFNGKPLAELVGSEYSQAMKQLGRMPDKETS